MAYAAHGRSPRLRRIVGRSITGCCCCAQDESGPLACGGRASDGGRPARGHVLRRPDALRANDVRPRLLPGGPAAPDGPAAGKCPGGPAERPAAGPRDDRASRVAGTGDGHRAHDPPRRDVGQRCAGRDPARRRRHPAGSPGEAAGQDPGLRRRAAVPRRSDVMGRGGGPPGYSRVTVPGRGGVPAGQAAAAGGGHGHYGSRRQHVPGTDRHCQAEGSHAGWTPTAARRFLHAPSAATRPDIRAPDEHPGRHADRLDLRAKAVRA